jgi:hypothetical protein
MWTKTRRLKLPQGKELNDAIKIPVEFEYRWEAAD